MSLKLVMLLSAIVEVFPRQKIKFIHIAIGTLVHAVRITRGVGDWRPAPLRLYSAQDGERE